MMRSATHRLLPGLSLTAAVLLAWSPGASALIALAHGSAQTVFETTGACITVRVEIAATSIPPTNWYLRWSSDNDYSTPTGGGFDPRSGYDSVGSTSLGSLLQTEDTIYDRCFPTGSHGYITVHTELLGISEGVILSEDKHDDACHWGHGPACA